MAERIRGHDWASTPLGPIEAWPQSLRTTVDLLLSGAFPMVVLWGAQLIQVYNDGYRDLMGIEHPQGLGRAAREWRPEAWHNDEPIYRRVRAGETLTFENGFHPVARSGRFEDAWFTLTYSPVRNETGAIAGVLVTLIEMTSHVLAERALRESEHRYRALFNSMDEAYAVVEVLRDDAKGWNDFLFLEVNPAFMKHTGMPYPVGRTATQILGTPNPRWAEMYGRVVETGAPVRFEETEATLGRVFDLNVFRLGGAESRRVAVLFTNITERNRSEAALRDSEERFRLIVENAHDYAIFITDPQDRVTDWFPGAETVFGWSAEEILGRPADLIFTPEDREAGEPEKEIAVARTGAAAADRRWHLRKDGRRVFIEGSVTALRRPDGSLQGFLKIGQDVTERRAYEEALKASERHTKFLLAELQHRVRNTLGVIRSIARRTAATSGTAEDFAMHLEGRIDAFARVQAAVTRDPEAGLDLEMLVADELRAVAAHEGEQVKRISGPRTRLQPKAAETLALAIHELATNAVKYGALAASQGRIEVVWIIDSSGGQSRLVFQWIETGVPLANDQPRRRGFGTELIERTLGYELGGDAKLDFTPNGLRCTIVLPMDMRLFLLDRESRRQAH
ncbi:PAS domain S-box protein [Microvirga sp. M2]|uniref:PAS domain-containing sensor histidine kinase n=1 Tax=Microvirga sp. M2 TaxID=3073270 RepID=UPI0039C33974